jgi:predicted MFS family arabinose efflux permease
VKKWNISPMTATIGVIGFLTVGFCFFNEFVNSIYWYLFADVVPKAFMGRFLGLFRVVSTLGGMAFNAFVFPHSLTHMQWAYGGVSLLYLVGFSLMCFKVKEGKYPPVTDVTESSSVWSQIKLYMRECFSHPIYIFVFLGTGLFGISTLVTIGNDFFAIDALHISMTQIGWVAGWAGWGALLLQYPCGWISDRFGPLRVSMVSVALIALVNFAQFFYMHSFTSYIAFTVVNLVVGSIYGAAWMPMLIAVLPESKFGQFCSANGTFKSAVIIAFGSVGAMWLDWVTKKGSVVDNYRYAFLWVGVCYVLYAITLAVVIRYWQQRGGVRGYVAPGEEAAAVPAPTSDDVAPPP